MLACFGFLIVDSLLAVLCNVSFVRTEKLSVRLVVSGVLVLILWTLSFAFIPLAISFTLVNVRLRGLPPPALTNDLTASMFFG